MEKELNYLNQISDHCNLIAGIQDEFSLNDYVSFENSNLEARLNNCSTLEQRNFELNETAKRVERVQNCNTICSTVVKGTKALCITSISIFVLKKIVPQVVNAIKK